MGHRASFNFESSLVLGTAVEAMTLEGEKDIYPRLALVELSTEHGIRADGKSPCLIEGRVLFYQLQEKKLFWDLGVNRPTNVYVTIVCRLHELGRLHTYDIRQLVVVRGPEGSRFYRAGPNKPLESFHMGEG